MEDKVVAEALHSMEIENTPNIALVGMASAGKSSLMNALFGTPISKVKKTANTTNCIVRTVFRNGIVVYDTPGVGGDEILENLARAFLGLRQVGGAVLDKIPYRGFDNNEIKYVDVSEIRNQMSIDIVLFVVDLSRTLLRKEYKDIKELISEIKKIYGNKMVVVGTHLDLIKELDEKDELIDSYKEISEGSPFVAVSSTTKEGLNRLVEKLFEFLPDETYLKKFQESLNSKLKLEKSKLAIIEIGKRLQHILQQKDEYSLKLHLVAFFLKILSYFYADISSKKAETMETIDKLVEIYRKSEDKFLEKLIDEVFELVVEANNISPGFALFNETEMKELNKCIEEHMAQCVASKVYTKLSFLVLSK